MSNLIPSSFFNGDTTAPIVRRANRAVAEIAADTRVTVERDAAQTFVASVAISNLRAIRREAAEAAAEDPAGAGMYDDITRTLHRGSMLRVMRTGL